MGNVAPHPAAPTRARPASTMTARHLGAPESTDGGPLSRTGRTSPRGDSRAEGDSRAGIRSIVRPMRFGSTIDPESPIITIYVEPVRLRAEGSGGTASCCFGRATRTTTALSRPPDEGSRQLVNPNCDWFRRWRPGAEPLGTARASGDADGERDGATRLAFARASARRTLHLS